MSFFDTKEFQDFKRVHTRVQEEGGNTLKNIDIYVNRFVLAVKKAEEFNNIGFYWIDGFRPAYKWAPEPKLSKANYAKKDIDKFINHEPETNQIKLF